MVRLREMMSRDVQALHPADTLREAAEVLTTEHISGAPVVEGNEVVGVLSSTDILDFVASHPGTPRRRDRQTAWGDFEGRGGYPPAEEDESASVYFTELWADAGAEVMERFEQSDSPEWNVLAEHDVSEAMSRGLFALPPEASADEAARYLLEHEIHRVLVLEDDELVGVVTTSDVVRAVAEHGLGA